ncbi:cytochrome P450 [Actinacidiphila acidipaludis]|uniref:Cytochrome P450 n=1 Tax=Actinacidiphila acidipaludis TaxID=2873382 RepID=A0ABS7QCJ2_9ACTN|nr:cytochrome P450 [Streptomyces acidipaludis]MBY8880873.1 cytochrome P450 [Streptomyces acidipaludis]
MEQHTGNSGPPPGCPAHENLKLYGPAFGANPDSHYNYLRAMGPIATVDIADGVEVRLVTAYTTALEVLKNSNLFIRDSRTWRALQEGRVDPNSPALPMMAWRPNALFADGAAHARLRPAVTDSLKLVDEQLLGRQAEQVADYLISQFSSPLKQVDLVQEYTSPLPLLVFGSLFGCPPELGDRIIAGITGIFTGVPDADVMLGTALFELVALKRRQPGDDVTSRLLAHQAGLTDEEACNQLVTMLSGGTAPLTAAISTGIALMLGDEKYATGNYSARDAVQEVLWNYAPLANYAAHYPVADVKVGNQVLYAHDPVLISFAGANTDPSARNEVNSESHLAFGAGPHACPAKDPAWVIAVKAIETLMKRLPDLELRCDFHALTWNQDPWTRSLVSLPVRYTTPAPIPRRSPAAAPMAAAEPAAPAAAPEPLHATASSAGSPQAPRRKKGMFSRLVDWINGQ